MNTIASCTQRERYCDDVDHARSETHESEAHAPPHAGVTESPCEHAMSVAGGIAGGAFGFGLGSAGGPGVAVAGAVGGATVGMSMGREIGGAVCGPLMSLQWGDLWPLSASDETAPSSSEAPGATAERADASPGTGDAGSGATAPSAIRSDAGVRAPGADAGSPPTSSVPSSSPASSKGTTEPPDTGAQKDGGEGSEVCGPSASYYFG